MFVLKIVLLSILVSVSIAVGLSALFSTEGIVEMSVGYVLSLFSALLQGAAWVTVIFALLEYYEVSIGPDQAFEKWEPSQLSELPENKALISRGESVFSIIMTTVFLMLFFLLSDRIGIYYNVGREISFIPLFNNDVIDSYLILVVLVFLLNILIELINIIKGRWTLKIAVITTLLNVISAGLFIAIINSLTLWNNEIIQEFERYAPLSFERLILLITIVVIAVTIGESGSALYKGVKYGE
ncbi:MAG: hypothetical protein JJU16_06995 [Alkalibacterium sp.]|nr:hypothetical protein [Alkalibacterium sp.]